MSIQQLSSVLALGTMMVLVLCSGVAEAQTDALAKSGVEEEQAVDLGAPGAPGQPGRPEMVRWTTSAVKAISGRIENGETITINGSGFGNGGGIATVSGNQVSPAANRFELGNSPVFADCTWHKVQVPLEWSDQKVLLSLNLSLAQEGDTIYLFFVEENRVVRPGYPLKDVLGANEEIPGQPGIPSIGL